MNDKIYHVAAAFTTPPKAGNVGIAAVPFRVKSDTVGDAAVKFQKFLLEEYNTGDANYCVATLVRFADNGDVVENFAFAMNIDKKRGF